MGGVGGADRDGLPQTPGAAQTQTLMTIPTVNGKAMPNVSVMSLPLGLLRSLRSSAYLSAEGVG